MLPDDVLAKIEEKLNDKQVAVFREFAKHDEGEGFTSEEVEKRLNLTHQAVSPRLSELMKMELLEDKGTRRKTTANRPAIVYTLKRP